MIARSRLFYALICVCVVAFDQLTKYWATMMLTDGRIIKILDGEFIWLVLVHNSGIAFGIDIIPQFLLISIHFIASIGLGLYLFFNHKIQRLHGMALALVMGGAIGNLSDRLIRGEVTDFISLDMPNFLMQRWPVFNIADSAVFIGVAILVALMFYKPQTQDNMILPDVVEQSE